MSRPLDTLLRPSLLAVAIAFAVPLASGPLLAAEQASSVRAYNLPSAPLASTLNQIASQAGLALSLSPSLVSGKQSAPVQGQFDAIGALREALRGTGLQLEQSSAGTYSLAAVPEGVMALPETSVIGAGISETAWGPTEGYAVTRTAAGTKTDTPIVELPRSVSVVTRQQMEDRSVLNLNDALRYTAGVQSSGYGSDSRNDWLLVRGFVPTQFLDGLPLPKGNYVTPKIETWNLERIAVLRGPASSVYGQTPPGGLLDMVSRRPQAESSHEVEVQAGSYEHKQINFDSTGKVDDEGQFLYRVSGTVRDSNSQVDHIPDKRYNLAPSLTWNINDDTRLTFLTQFTRDDTGITGQFLPLQGTKLSSPAGKISHHKNLGDPEWEFYDRTYYALGYAFEHRLNDTWQFRQNLRYTKSDLETQGISAGGQFWPAGPDEAVSADGTIKRSASVIDEDISQFAVDNNFQADFQTGVLSHTLLLGLDHQRSNSNARWDWGSNGVPTSNIHNPIYGQDFSNVQYFTMYDYNQKTNQTGLYIQDQMALDNWRLTLGGREDWVHTGTEFHNLNNVTNTQRDKKFSGNAALSYVFDNGVTPYISFAQSFQAAAGSTVNSTDAFKPTEGEQYEAGIKYQPPGTRTLLTAAVFDLTQKNNSVTENNVTRQVGEVQVRGLELEASGNVTDNLKLVGSYTYNDSEITKGTAAEKGKRMAQVPRNQATAWADYTWHNGLLDGFGVGAGVRYVGDTYGNTTNTDWGHVGSYTVYDASAHYDLGRLNKTLKGVTVAVDAKNIFNKDYLSTCDGFYCYYGDQRNVVASVNYKW
ncbi:iron complex outermembrane recepter protein [Pseudomonas sp. NFACC32-1]|uniref:TonB-dependent siderophore receptor n=1 Tax=Pseudomonas TaxID=286 RepID=UPI000876EA2D|nr:MULTISPECIES: TonB-dependent siderophore receptor [Pseudomonas]MDT8908636.1 TonB-dependent siderophore receptor [Pseudomonas prosekii]NHN71381.1 TonB-dependent siderophore receptor [Pseudomonas fluorescens]ROO41514.1 TonB-dependent receptor [Pseudomonas sp. AF76]ROO42199.1 TonB-dependent receptor [Pseudomonas sp. 7SR1]SCX47697.1 iron complex outermembrane recepter protein [Pseudomonas sp. NFACC32-1]